MIGCGWLLAGGPGLDQMCTSRAIRSLLLAPFCSPQPAGSPLDQGLTKRAVAWMPYQLDKGTSRFGILHIVRRLVGLAAFWQAVSGRIDLL
jgi:hypothetical protein